MKKCVPNERCEWYVLVQGGYTEPPVDHFTFESKDVLPIYDVYDDGSMILYIKRKKFFGLRECVTRVNDSDIDYVEIPERRICE
jgi:hypothetical protein